MSEKIDLFDDDNNKKAAEAMYQMRMQQAKEQSKSPVNQAMEPLLEKAREERKELKKQKEFKEQNLVNDCGDFKISDYGEKRGGKIIREDFNKEIYSNPSEISKEVKDIMKNQDEQNERLHKEMDEIPEMTQDDLHLEKQENKLSKNISSQTVEENKKRLQQTDKDFLDNF